RPCHRPRSRSCRSLRPLHRPVDGRATLRLRTGRDDRRHRVARHRRGGEAESHICDHLDPEQIAKVVRRIEAAHGRLDILVNDIGGETYVDWGPPFWATDFASEMRLVRAGLLAHLHTAHAALPLLTRTPGGLHIEITDGTAAYNASHYRESIFLDHFGTTERDRMRDSLN